MTLIEDGSGGGNVAKVSTQNRLYTEAISIDQEVQANRDGNAYNINTGIINLTNATDTPVLYFKNNENKDAIITAVVIGLFNSTGGSSTADVYTTFIMNPSTGTIISGASNVDIISNRNAGSGNTLDANAYKGATGNTMTDGRDHVIVRITPGSRSFIGINEIIPKGKSFGVKIKPPTSNTSMNIYAAIICHLDEI
jgi:hypothetical protein